MPLISVTVAIFQRPNDQMPTQVSFGLGEGDPLQGRVIQLVKDHFEIAVGASAKDEPATFLGFKPHTEPSRPGTPE